MMTYPKAPKIAIGRTLLVLLSAAVFAVPAHAGDDPPKPVTDKSVTASDVVATPAEDLNLKKQQIPDILIKAQQDPYDVTGLRKCGKITAEIDSLNQTLGPDYDLALNDADKMSVGSVAKSVVGAFIPFRGVIREISGANKHQQDLQAAVTAGMTRRAFLKGIGMKQGCGYPARPADSAVRAQVAAEAERAAKESDARNPKKG